MHETCTAAPSSPISTFAKGYAMGAANVIPGVSGGTVAFITGIFETLINALKSFDMQALQLLLKFRIKDLWNHVNAGFLLPLGLGVASSFATLARLLEFLFDHYPIFIWAFFFGLIIASVYYVGKTVEQWKIGPVLSFMIGAAVAIGVGLIKPVEENSGQLYLLACGIIAICSMIIPGLSGSFVLILLGNYRLILGALSDLVSALTSFQLSEVVKPLGIIIPVGIGAVVGLLAFSHLISWVFRRFRDVAVSLMTGFVAGSLLIIWPWKTALYLLDAEGNPVIKKGTEKIIQGYQWHAPALSSGTTWAAFGLMAVGITIVIAMESMARKRA